MDKKGKEGSFKGVILVMIFSLAIAGLWDSVPVIKNAIHAVLDPTAGVLLDWNLTGGMLFLVLVLSIITTLVQKYATDQETLRELKKEQRELQKEMKKYKDHPEKLMELQKKSFEFLPKTLKLSMRSIVYTAIPFILMFKWFWDYFTAAGEPLFFGFMSWFIFYILASMIIGGILRKILKVV